MKICDIVKNSVWYDPRVRKQIISYTEDPDCEIEVIGVEDLRYDGEKVAQYPCKIQLVHIDPKYFGDKRTFFMKLKREIIVNHEMINMIVQCNPDIIHANDLNAMLPAYRAAKRLKCKIIYDSHEIFVENAGVVNHKFIRMIWVCLEKFFVKRISKMICVSDAAANYFKELYGIDKPMVVTNCTLKGDQCNAKNKNGGFEVLNHGQFYAGRGYDIMVEAACYLSKYSDIKLVMRGYGNLEQSLRIRVEKLGLNNVKFYPKVSVEELIPMASKSHIGVAITEAICLNFKLSVSNKLFEYAAAGLPVIMSDIPEHRYLNDKYHFGIVIPDNKPETFAQAVIKLYEDKAFYNECAENARKLSNEVNWEKEFKKLIDFEKSIISNN